MNFEQLSGLIKAGFTEEQIRNIGSIMGTGTSTGTGTGTNTPTNGGTLPGAAQSTPTPTPGGTLTGAALSTPTTTPTTTPAPTPTDTPTPTPTATPAEQGGTQPTGESETVTLLKEMLGMMQRGNINTMGTGAMQEQTGADVLAEILNPTPKTK